MERTYIKIEFVAEMLAQIQSDLAWDAETKKQVKLANKLEKIIQKLENLLPEDHYESIL